MIMKTKMWEPGGFQRPLPARHREWKTKTGKANFVTPEALDEDPDMPGCGSDTLRLITCAATTSSTPPYMDITIGSAA
jgi:hypothetical protein